MANGQCVSHWHVLVASTLPRATSVKATQSTIDANVALLWAELFIFSWDVQGKTKVPLVPILDLYLRTIWARGPSYTNLRSKIGT